MQFLDDKIQKIKKKRQSKIGQILPFKHSQFITNEILASWGYNTTKKTLVSTTKDSMGMSGTNPAASNHVLTGTADTCANAIPE